MNPLFSLAALAILYVLSIALEYIDPPCTQTQQHSTQHRRDRNATSTGKNPQIEEQGRRF